MKGGDDWEQQKLDEIDPDKLRDGAAEARIARLVDEAMAREQREGARCDGCGRLPSAGCDCNDNRLAIGRGERRKAEREEG